MYYFSPSVSETPLNNNEYVQLAGTLGQDWWEFKA